MEEHRQKVAMLQTSASIAHYMEEEFPHILRSAILQDVQH